MLQSDFTIRFAAGGEVRQAEDGCVVIPRAVAAQAGVGAKGHYCWLDKDGILTMDEDKMVRELPMRTDEKTLSTALEASKSASRFRVRSDHSDTLGSRAGYVDNFAVAGDKLICDVNLFESYCDRNVVVEAYKKTPELIGLSMDFGYSIEEKDGAAYIRVKKINAIDIVDEGAVTPRGMLRSVHERNNKKLSVDNNEIVERTAQPTTKITMDPEAIKAALAEALKPLNEKLDSLISRVDDLEGVDVDEELAAEDKDKKDEKTAEAKASAKRDAALVASFSAVVKAGLEEQRKTFAALGIKPAAASAELTPEQKAAAEAASADPVAKFNAIVTENKKTMKSTDAVRFAIKQNPELYQNKLKAQGIA